MDVRAVRGRGAVRRRDNANLWWGATAAVVAFAVAIALATAFTDRLQAAPGDDQLAPLPLAGPVDDVRIRNGSDRTDATSDGADAQGNKHYLSCLEATPGTPGVTGSGVQVQANPRCPLDDPDLLFDIVTGPVADSFYVKDSAGRCLQVGGTQAAKGALLDTCDANTYWYFTNRPGEDEPHLMIFKNECLVQSADIDYTTYANTALDARLCGDMTSAASEWSILYPQSLIDAPGDGDTGAGS